MNKQPTVAIVGGTGVIGSEIVSMINELKLPLGKVSLFASENSVGELYDVLDGEVRVEALDSTDFKGIDIAVFAIPLMLVEKYVSKALKAGCVVVDTSAFYRLKPEASLIVPAVNLCDITKETKLIACPNTCVMQLAPLFQTVKKLVGVKRAVVTSLQPVASAGKIALDELWDQTLSIFRQSEIKSEAFQHQIAFNCIPQIGVFLENGYTTEEMAIQSELRRVLKADELELAVTAVRMPVFHGSSLVVNIETEEDLEIITLHKNLTEIIDLEVVEAQDEYPMPLSVVTNMENVVARIRKPAARLLDCWIAADGIRACIACGVARILEQVIKVQAEG